MSTRLPAPDLEPNVLEIDLEAIRHNVGELQRLAGAGCDLYAALKCDAYGFGLVPAARALVEGGVAAISVARIGDAISLREGGIEVPVLLYAGAVVTPELAAALGRYDLIPSVLDLEAAAELSRSFSSERPVFVKVDVGQHRLGVEPSVLTAFATAVAGMPNLRLAGVYTHMTVPDDPVPEGHIEKQFALFESCLRELDETGLEVPVRMAASSSVLRLTDRMGLNAVDPGRMYFGIVPDGGIMDGYDFRSALRLFSSRLLQVKTLDEEPRRPAPLVPVSPGMRLGIIALGTSDGLALASGREVLVRGVRAPLIEPISLEHCRVDLTGVPDACPGDEVVVIGRQGDDEIAVDEVVERRALKSSKHNIPINIRESVRRRYVG
ncbi:MAG TPA: alanine racemase [Gaiellaceae bacterium]|jgi:alanine racemase|nr:alanine racemase [Gaiellaceae bacterium]